MDIKEQIRAQIKEVLKEISLEWASIAIEIPTDISHGDYSTNVAFSSYRQVAEINKSNVPGSKKDGAILASVIGSFNNPFELAEWLAKKLGDKNIPFLGKIEAVRPGFLNFWLSDTFLGTHINSVLQEPEKVARTIKLKEKRVVVEFTDANPFKEFHVGHVYTNTVGESLSRILESQGAVVWRADYFSDVGMHVAKALYGLEQKFQEEHTTFEELTQKPLNERIKYLGQAYAKGATLYEESKEAQEEMKVLNRLAYVAAQKMWEKEKGLTPQVDYVQGQTIDDKKFNRVYKLYTTGRAWSMEYFESIFSRLGMKFDGYYPESIAAERGYHVVKEHIADGIFEEHDGAVVFRGEKYNLHTRVFINSLGLPTYEAKELGLAPWKYEDFAYDESIIVTGNEIKEYFKVLIAAMSAINPALGAKTHHLPHGMVRLPEGKMSSRTGKIVTGEWLINEAVEHAKKLSKEDAKVSSDVEQVGIGAIKYAFLKSGIGKDIEFDFETSLSLTGNSGPYIQYTYVRTQSILEKAHTAGIEAHYPLNYTPSEEEKDILRQLVHFKEVISYAADNLSPSAIASYVYELAKAFNLFYQTARVVDATAENERTARVALTQAVGFVLQSALYLLGIEAPKRM